MASMKGLISDAPNAQFKPKLQSRKDNVYTFTVQLLALVKVILIIFKPAVYILQ